MNHSPGRILIIDDEPAVGRALARSLAREFQVEVSTSARAALDLLRTDEGFDLILCDLAMPGLSGPELYDRIRGSRAAARVVFMTGGAVTRESQEFLSATPNPRLEKPFTLEEVRAMMRARSAGGG
jgi:DNA-binding response OmpR family regulator